MAYNKKKERALKVFTYLGLVFVVVLGLSYLNAYKERGELIESQLEVPQEFARQFSRVIKNNRMQELPSTPFINHLGVSMDWPDLRGQHTLVNFWATWCAPCVIELPSLNELQKNYADKGLNVIAVSLDTMRGHDFIKAFLDNRNIGEFAAHHDYAKNIQNNITMRGIPTTYLIDPKGNLTHIFEGDADWSSHSARQFFNTLLGV